MLKRKQESWLLTVNINEGYKTYKTSNIELSIYTIFHIISILEGIATCTG